VIFAGFRGFRDPKAHEATAAGDTAQVREIEAEIDRLAAGLWGLSYDCQPLALGHHALALAGGGVVGAQLRLPTFGPGTPRSGPGWWRLRWRCCGGG